MSLVLSCSLCPPSLLHRLGPKAFYTTDHWTRIELKCCNPIQSYFDLFNFPPSLRCIHTHRRLRLLARTFPWIRGLFTRASLLIFPVLAALPAVSGVNTSQGSHLTWTVALAPLLWSASVSLSVSLADGGFPRWPACLRPASFRPLLRSSVCSCWCHRSTSAHVTSHSWTHQADLECPCLFDIFTVFYSCLLLFPLCMSHVQWNMTMKM